MKALGPALETVAGVAVRRWLISNSSLIVGFSGIRSLLASVSTYSVTHQHTHALTFQVENHDSLVRFT